MKSAPPLFSLWDMTSRYPIRDLLSLLVRRNRQLYTLQVYFCLPRLFRFVYYLARFFVVFCKTLACYSDNNTDDPEDRMRFQTRRRQQF